MLKFLPLKDADYAYDYVSICADINRLHREEKIEDALVYMREMCKRDLFFLMYFVLGVHILNSHKWLVERVYEVQHNMNLCMHLWPREHFKSTIISFGAVIWYILNNPDKRVCILSYNRTQSKALMRRIKQTFEQNEALKELFSDVLWANPGEEAPKWSEDEGITVKRTTVYREATLEAWGLVDGQPTGSHYDWRLYDDIVTPDNTGTPEQIRKTTDAFGMSHNLGTRGGWSTVVGTIYHYSDLLVKLKTEGLYRTILHTAEDVDGHGVYMTDDELAQKKALMGSYIYACQMMLNPVADDNQVFKREWLKYYDNVTHRLNKYIVVDPAGKKGSKNDYTVMWVIGVDGNKCHYIIDCVRDKLNLKERWDKLKELVDKHAPIMNVGYEKYGMQSDIEYMQDMMEREGYFFNIQEVGGNITKENRIRNLQPRFQQGEFILPKAIWYTDTKGQKSNLVDMFIVNEYDFFPYSTHDDMLDCLARILEDKLGVVYPMSSKLVVDKQRNNSIFFSKPKATGLTWMAR